MLGTVFSLLSAIERPSGERFGGEDESVDFGEWTMWMHGE